MKVAEQVAALARQKLPGTKIILSTWFFDEAEWQGLEKAVATVIAEGKSVTYDLKADRNDPTAVGTREMAEAICKILLARRLGCPIGELEQRGFMIRSAGVAASNGAAAAPHAVDIIRDLGGSLENHRSRSVASNE